MYNHDDNYFNTRYSELVNCIPSKIDEIVYNRINGIKPEPNAYMEFGTKRHEKFAEHLKKGKLPQSFNLNLKIKNIEKQQSKIVFGKVKIHFTPDAEGDDWIVDFKTTGNPLNFKNHKQLDFYAWLLGGKKKGYYLCEVWDKFRTEILGYEVIEKEITGEDIIKIEEWAKKRINLLYSKLKEQGWNTKTKTSEQDGKNKPKAGKAISLLS